MMPNKQQQSSLLFCKKHKTIKIQYRVMNVKRLYLLLYSITLSRCVYFFVASLEIVWIVFKKVITVVTSMHQV